MSDGASVTAQRELFPQAADPAPMPTVCCGKPVHRGRVPAGPYHACDVCFEHYYPPSRSPGLCPSAAPPRLSSDRVSATCPRCDYARAIPLDGLGKVQCCACGEIHRSG